MKARILVVEDDPAIRRLVQLVLSDKGFDLSLAPDGPSAVEQARMNHPDVVLLDYMLPGDDGEVVARELRAVCGDVPILLMSAADDLVPKAERVGALDRLDKPFELSELEAAVTRALHVARPLTRRRIREDVRPPSIPHVARHGRTEQHPTAG